MRLCPQLVTQSRPSKGRIAHGASPALATIGRVPGNPPSQDWSWVRAGTPVLEREAVVAPAHDVEKAAIGRRVGVVVDTEYAPARIDAEAKGFPHPRRQPPQTGTVGAAGIHVAAFATPAERCAIGTDEPVGRAQVFARAEQEPSLPVEGHAAEPVVRVIAGGFQLRDLHGTTLVRDAIMVGILQAEDPRAGGDVNCPVGRGRQGHRVRQPLEIGREAVGAPVSVGVLEDP